MSVIVRQRFSLRIAIAPAARGGKVTIVAEPTIPDVLRERASLQPDEKAFTYVDYEQDWDGIADT